MSIHGYFPFGQPVRDIVQTDQTAKKVFILGVYASAVHAQWKGVDNRVVVQALAIGNRLVTILPLAHPRQVARLGRSSKKWYEFHQYWRERMAAAIFSE